MKFSEIHPFVRYARIVDNSQTNKLSIPYDCRLFYILKGNADIFVKNSDFSLSTNDVIIINTGIKYRITDVSDDLEILAFNFDYTFENSHLNIPIPPEFNGKIKRENLISPVTFSDYPEFNDVVCVKDMGIGSEFLLSALKEHQKNLLMSDTLASSYLSGFFSLLIRKKEAASTPADNIISFVRQNIGENITNIEVAKKFNYHPNYVNSLVRSKTGMPLHKYIIHIRIRRAIELLETTDMPISEIAREVGFCDISYFSNYFKKITGRAPKFYKNK